MGRRTIAGHKLTFNKYRKPAERVCPADLSGKRLQDIFVEWVKDLMEEESVISAGGQSFFHVSDVRYFNDYIVIASTMSGKAGEEGVVYDSESGETRLTLTVKDVPTSTARAILICPPRGDAALWFSEYSARSSGASLLLSVFKKRWDSFDTGTTFNKNRLIAAEIALENAAVTEVEVRMVRRSDDRADGLTVRGGTISHKFKAAKGNPLSGKIINKFRSDRAKAYDLVEIKDSCQDEDSQIYVSVDVDGYRRKVDIFNLDDGVYFREELNAKNEPPLSDVDLVAYCAGEARIFLERSGCDWDESWAHKG